MESPFQSGSGANTLVTKPRKTESVVGVGKNALVVDSSHDVRVSLSAICTGLGYKVRGTKSASVAMDIIFGSHDTDEKIDLLICEWDLPVIPGIIVAEEIRAARDKNPLFYLPVFIMMTYTAIEEEVIRAGENLGLVQGYLVKPVNDTLLANKIINGEEKRGRLIEIIRLRQAGETKYGKSHPERYNAAIERCMMEFTRINSEIRGKYEASVQSALQNMDARLQRIASGQEKFATEADRKKFAARYDKLRAGGEPPPAVVWPIAEAIAMLLDTHQTDKARDLLETAAQFGKSAGLYAEIGRVYETTGEHDLALEAYREAVKLNVKFLHAHDRLARLLERLGKKEEAFHAITAAVQISPQTPMRRRTEGEIGVEIGKFAEAEAAFRVALEHDKGRNGVLNNLNLGKAMLAQPDRILDAGKYFYDAERLMYAREDSTHPDLKRDVCIGFGEYLLISGQETEAERKFNTAMTKFCDDQGGSANDYAAAKICEAYLKTGKQEKAQELIANLIDADPKDKSRQKIVRDMYDKFQMASQAEALIESALDRAAEAVEEANRRNIQRRRKAVEAIDRGNDNAAISLFTEALREYNRLIERYMSDEGLYFNRGVLLRQLVELLGSSIGAKKIKEYNLLSDMSLKRAYELDPVRIGPALEKLGISVTALDNRISNLTAQGIVSAEIESAEPGEETQPTQTASAGIQYDW